jgi:hypothetical protein
MVGAAMSLKYQEAQATLARLEKIFADSQAMVSDAAEILCAFKERDGDVPGAILIQLQMAVGQMRVARKNLDTYSKSVISAMAPETGVLPPEVTP